MTPSPDRDFSMWTPGLFDLFRILLGIYLASHFVGLLLWGTELFSSAGMIADAGLSPLYALVPNIFWLGDSPLFVLLVIASGVVAAVAMVLKQCDRVAAIWILLVLISLFCRNPLIANPGMPYLGWLLLAYTFLPRTPARGEVRPWRAPPAIFAAAAVVLAITYSYSGWTKVLSPTWLSGDTLTVVLNNPLARDWWLRDLFLLIPSPVLAGVTWFILWVELLYAPLYLIRRFRFLLWSSMLFVQFGFLFLLNFPDLTIPMLLFHLLTFEPRWLNTLKSERPAILLYDGNCGVCHRLIQFTLKEDLEGHIRFIPLQAEQAGQFVDNDRIEQLDSMVILEGGKTYLHSDAVIRWLRHLGGLWPAFGLVLGWFPKPARDLGYRWFGQIRLKLMKAPTSLCPILPPMYRERFDVQNSLQTNDLAV